MRLQSSHDALTEQIRIANSSRFGRHTEKLDHVLGQGTFDAEGHVCIDEAEALHDQNPDPAEPTVEQAVRKSTPRPKGKKEQDLKDIEVIRLQDIDVSEEDRVRAFGSLENCRRMPDEVFRHLVYIPAGWKIEEQHVAVYRSRYDKGKFLKGETPSYLLRGSLVTASLEAAIINAKYVDAVPLRRLEQNFKTDGIFLSEQNMASWTIKCADRYLIRLYDYLHGLLLPHPILQADETTVEVCKDGRSAGSKSYMWVYRTGPGEKERPIILYDYQKIRNHEHPIEFLKGFEGTLVCDGYGGYKTMSRKVGTITIAECWAHTKRKFMDALKAQKRSDRSGTIAAEAAQRIAAIYHEDGKLKELSSEERKKQRQEKILPLVEDFFTWIHAIDQDRTLLMSDETRKGITYCVNQEEYLETFLYDGDVPMDNNRTEGAIRPFTIGRKNWMAIDTVSGAKASAVIYSLVETAKANDLNPYFYIRHLLTEIPKLKEFPDDKEEGEAMERIVPWSESLPEECHKRGR